MIALDTQVCQSLESAVRHEWLETNGLGGFASSTVAGLNTRRYHGLLIAATKPPVGRLVLLSKLQETLVVDGRRYELSANQYPGVVHPQGYQYLVGFRVDPFPIFTFRCGGVELQKRVFMVHGENTTVIEYECSAGTLEVRPLIAFRDFHSTTHENGALNSMVREGPGMVSVKPYGDLPALHLAHNAQSVEVTGQWYRNFEFQEERARGLDFREDLFQPFALHFDLRAPAVVIASIEVRDAASAPVMRQREIDRRDERPITSEAEAPNNLSFASNAAHPLTDVRSVAEAPRKMKLAPPWQSDLAVRELFRAADQFIVDRGALKTVVAGYHWFSDWGRDTMIALPGLTLSTGRHDVARQILEAFAGAVNQGMLPNRFPDSGETAEYNTVDATLWFFEAARAYLEATEDAAFVTARLLPKMTEIIDWHLRGTRYGIRVDSADGLLQCGEAGVQLTWMDAKVGDWVVTPRQGKPVEIQALWYNALCIIESLSGDARYGAMAEQARESFGNLFWNAEANCLYDVVDGEHHRDPSIRPNQIFAVSLPHSMLDGAQARAVVDKVQVELLTPMGLRTLAQGDQQYRGQYGGGVLERDGAYHQGTVWPWLIGPFLRAYLKVHQQPEAGEQARLWLAPLLEFARTRGLGQLPEIADGDFPHAPGGCIAQAWSVAEVLRSSGIMA